MAQQGATLQNYNNELVKCLEELRDKREILNKQIIKEEKQKAEVQRKLHKLTEELHRLNQSLTEKVQARNDYDTTIQETEAAYMKILESSQTLLHVLKRETVSLVKKQVLASSSSADFASSEPTSDLHHHDAAATMGHSAYTQDHHSMHEHLSSSAAAPRMHASHKSSNNAKSYYHDY